MMTQSMQVRAWHVGLLAMLMGLVACSTVENKPQKTELQWQQLQTMRFDASKRSVYKATQTVFLNQGYTLQGGELDTGDMRFVKSADSTKSWFSGKSTAQERHATAVVTADPADPDKASLRLGFKDTTKVTTRKFGLGGLRSDDEAFYRRVDDPKVYQGFFAQVRQAIFVHDAVF